jgi:N-acetylglucosaminyldiphosphoundecaprenol N-acetyl-beta-D-mannosaminyltransferase
MEIALDALEQWVTRREAKYVCVTGVHGIIESHWSPHVKAIHNSAGMVTPDGMPLVWLSRLKGFRDANRVYGPDLMLATCERFSGRGFRHFFYGGAPGVAEQLVGRLGELFPNVKIVGTYCPPFRAMTAEEDEHAVETIRAASPDIVWVGLSTPKQEIWMARHVEKLAPSVLIGCGAAFDFIAGVKAQAPRWVQRAGLEWAFRLITEPRRLWRRYLLNNPLFISLVLLQLLGVKTSAGEDISFESEEVGRK